jgi:RNA polymerase sigma-70 factor (ECF subfamily)
MALFGTDHSLLGDERLMELACRGDERAFTTLYDRYAGRVMNYFHRMLWQDRERARDMLQELFTKLAHKPQAYDTRRPFRTWLFSVAHNMCKNAYRHEEVRRAAMPHLQEAHNGAAKAVGGDALDKALFRERLRQELDRLEPDQRSTFEMRYHEEMAIKEIAEVMGCSEGTVKSRLFYTLKKLAVHLREFDPRNEAHGTPREIRS